MLHKFIKIMTYYPISKRDPNQEEKYPSTPIIFENIENRAKTMAAIFMLSKSNTLLLAIYGRWKQSLSSPNLSCILWKAIFNEKLLDLLPVIFPTCGLCHRVNPEISQWWYFAGCLIWAFTDLIDLIILLNYQTLIFPILLCFKWWVCQFTLGSLTCLLRINPFMAFDPSEILTQPLLPLMQTFDTPFI